MADIFISYASSDRPKAKVLAEALERHGWSVWWDRKIPIGRSFREVIEQALDSARCVVVLWTKTSAAKDWVLNEAEEGERRGILAPVLLEEVKIPLGLRHVQAANLSDWQPGVTHPEFDQLLASIEGILGSLPGQPPKHPEPVEAKHRQTGRPIVSPEGRIKPPPVAAMETTEPHSSGALAALLKSYWPVALAASALLVIVVLGLRVVTDGQERGGEVTSGVSVASSAEAGDLRPVRIGVIGRPAEIYIERNGTIEGRYVTTSHSFEARQGEEVRWELKRDGYQDMGGHFEVREFNEYDYSMCKIGEECPTD